MDRFKVNKEKVKKVTEKRSTVWEKLKQETMSNSIGDLAFVIENVPVLIWNG